jgi:hypothetical protein
MIVMTSSALHRDQRTLLVESASLRWAYLFISLGLLGLVPYRSLVWRVSPWDLLLLVVLGGAVPAAYQGYHQVLTSRWALNMFAAALVGGAVAALLVLFG